MSHSPSNFADAVATVESLPLDDQEALIEVINKRIIASRRQQLLAEIKEARADYRAGKVQRGSANELMRELRRS